MNLLASILSASSRAVGRAVRSVIPLRVTGKYDAAQTSTNNRRHWANADGLSANAAANPAVRQILRNRNRYEAANNGYFKGIQKTHANFVIGTGPRLQMLTDNPTLNAFIEKEFRKWCRKVRLAKKLRVMRKSMIESGESFGILTTNEKLNHPVKLDLRVAEADRVRSRLDNLNNPLEIDGILFDEEGNPVEYYVMKNHPGGLQNLAAAWSFDTVAAASMIHLFDIDRPEQSRGVPELTASLSLFSQLRRYTLAVVDAAETAANHAGVMQTTSPSGESAADVDLGATMEVERNMLTALPEGWTLGQMKPEQPTTQYPDFKAEIINEAARPLNMPFNIAAGNSSKYNYASGRLDHQVYFKSIDVERDDLEIEALDRVLQAWLDEAALIEGYLPQAARKLDVELEHQWFWDGVGHVDPVKDATAQDLRLRNNTTTLAEEYAKDGVDWETAIRQRAKEQQLLKQLGVTTDIATPGAPPKNPQPDPELADEEEQTSED